MGNSIFLAVLKVKILLKTFTISSPAQAIIISTLDYWNSCLLNYPAFPFGPLELPLHTVAKVIF